MREIWIVGLMVLAMASSVVAGELVIDDFSDGNLEAAPGLSWVVVADDLIGGAGAAKLRLVRAGAGHALALEGATGTPTAGVPVSFVGVWTSVGGDGLSRDLSAYQGIRVRARAPEGRFMVGVRGATTGMNFMAPATLSATWAEIDIPFSALKPLAPPGAETPDWTPADIAWLGLSANATTAGSVKLEVDHIGFYGGPRTAKGRVTPGNNADSQIAKSRLVAATTLRDLAWKTLAEEAAGDALRATLPDATSLAWAMDDDRVWFRVGLAAAPPERWFGINVALDTDDREAGMNWWGTNKAFRFDRLVTAYLSQGDDYWQGSLGVASAADVQRGAMNALGADVVASLDRQRNAIMVGVPRAALPAGRTLQLIATVGSSMRNNDDLPNEGAVEITLPPMPGR